MDIEDCKRLLHEHAKLRAPLFEKTEAASASIEKLENYMGDIAVARGDLEEARLTVDHARHTLEDKWNAIGGWQQQVGSKATGPQIIEAKKTIDPETYEGLREAKFLIAKLSDQIRRLEKDEENTSRRYTMLTGS